MDPPLYLSLATGRAFIGIRSLEFYTGSGNVKVSEGIVAWIAKSSVLKKGFSFA